MTAETRSNDAASSEETVLEIRNANVRFDLSRGQSRVLNGVDLDIVRGEILAIVGESGSGKSMFAAALLDVVEDPGLLTGEVTYHPRKSSDLRGEHDYTTANRGISTVDGTVSVLDLNSEESRRLRWEEIAMVFQGAMNSFNPTMKVRSHFEETIIAHNADIEERMEHARSLFDALHLDADRVLNSYPHELSGGMKQRALIALALVLEPEVLVMDEPTAALDMLMQRSIISMLRELRDVFDLTIVFITHDLPLVAGLADRIAVMYAFEFIEVGPTTEVLTDAAHPYTRALLRSLPSIDSVIDEMQPIDGTRPDPVHIPSGCSYHLRCPLMDERCTNEDPPLELDGTHTAACFYADRASEEIEYTLHGNENENASREED